MDIWEYFLDFWGFRAHRVRFSWELMAFLGESVKFTCWMLYTRLGSIFCSCKTLVAVPFFSLGKFQYSRCIMHKFPWKFQYFGCKVHKIHGDSNTLGAFCRKIPGKFPIFWEHYAQNPAMRPNRPAEKGDGTRWGLASAMVTLLTISDRYRYR